VTGRIQLASNVDDLTESIAFYAKLFGTEPAKVRPGYANRITSLRIGLGRTVQRRTRGPIGIIRRLLHLMSRNT
jgi:hypothetical protein